MPIQADERRFLEALESATLPAGQFHHRDHVHAAWLYLSQQPPTEAIARFCGTLKRFAAAAGQPGLYHETITWAYLLLIHERRERGDPAGRESFAAFAAQNADLLTWKPSALAPYYREETLASDLARRVFLLPDRHLPHPAEPSDQGPGRQGKTSTESALPTSS